MTPQSLALQIRALQEQLAALQAQVIDGAQAASIKIAMILRSSTRLLTVRFECGHSRKITRRDLESERLFRGNPVECLQCKRGKA